MGSCSLLLLVAALMAGIAMGEAQLSYDYYRQSCPNLETIMRKEMIAIFVADATAPAAFLRLLFHDCQVQGCDASILLDYDESTRISEMFSSRNFGVRHRESIQHMKDAIEVECPGQVSCADIIALAAKESVAISGGPHFQIPLGRKDSTTCSHQQADLHLPPSGFTVDGLLDLFTSKGMSVEESVAILGAHTLGVGHCINIVGRLYDSQPGYQMNNGYENVLKLTCPTKTPVTNLTVVPNDITPLIFDNQYYRDVMFGRGLFIADSTVSTDPRTASIVSRFAVDESYFFQVFSSAFVKLSETGVLSKRKGEIRRICNQVNKGN